jgi:hypothetical protein
MSQTPLANNPKGSLGQLNEPSISSENPSGTLLFSPARLGVNESSAFLATSEHSFQTKFSSK